MAPLGTVVAALFIVGARGSPESPQHHRCHVCLSGTSSDVEVDRVFPGADLESCQRATTPMVCPDKYRGCLTQSKGDQVMRTCAQLAVDACRWANGVEYCYCMGDLCNAPPPRSQPPSPPASDDEDMDVEGSGDSHIEPPAADDSSTSTTPAPTRAPRSVAVRASCDLTTVLLTTSLLVAVWR